MLVIGGYRNSRSLVRKSKYADVLADRSTYGILSWKMIREFVIEISESKFTSRNQEFCKEK